MLESPNGEDWDSTWVNTKGVKKLENRKCGIMFSLNHFRAGSYPVSALCTPPTLLNDLFVLESNLLITNGMAL